MELKITRDELQANVNKVMRAVPNKTTMPILSCILVTAENDEVHLMAMDMEMGVEAFCNDANVIENGVIAVDAKTFSGIVAKLPNGEVTISTTDEGMKIKSGKARFTIATKDGNDFPTLQDVSRDKKIELTQECLKDIIMQTIFSTSPNDNNKIMSGELFKVSGNHLRVVSLDGHRVAIREIELDKEYEPFEAIIPGKTLSEISRILTSGDVNVYFTDTNVMFEFNNALVTSRLIEGEYYSIDKMLNGEATVTVKIDRQEFMSSIERSMLLVGEDKKPVVMTVEDDLKLEVNANLGSMSESIEIEKDGNEIKLGMNPKFLFDVLRVIDDEKATMEFQTESTPCFIKGEGYVYIVLPVRIGG